MQRLMRVESFLLSDCVTGRCVGGQASAWVPGAAILSLLLAVPGFAGAPLEKPPVITSQPQSVSAPAGREAVLFVRGYGTGRLAFQWLRNGIPLEEANEPVLRLAALGSKQAGDYQVVLSNDYGRSTSEVARVTVAKQGGGAWTPASVFSCNAVGYINLSMAPGFTLVVNQLANRDSAGNEPVSRVVPFLPDGAVIHHVSSNRFTANAFWSGWRDPNAPLPFGDVFFLFNPYDSPVVVTFVGAVLVGDLRQTLPSGFSIAGSLVPQSGGVVSVLEMPVADGDEVWRWDVPTQDYAQFRYQTGGWQPQEPVISVGEAFVVKKTTAAVWRRVFSLFSPCDPPNPAAPMQRMPMLPLDGQLHFFTYHPNAEFGRVEGAGGDYFGQLYVGLSTNEYDLTPVGVPVRFQDGSRAGYLDGGIVATPGLPAGLTVQTQLRVWSGIDGASYEEARVAGCLTGKSEIVPARTEAPLVNDRPGIPPRPVNHFRTLRLSEIPGIATQPASFAVAIGESASLAVTTAHAGASSFQWRHNGQAIPGANGPELQLSALLKSDAGDYSVIVSNGPCALSSTNARLVVYESLEIQTEPADTNLVAGETARFTVTATGEPPLTYQWRSSAQSMSNRLSAATNAMLVLNVVDESEGDYWVEIRSPYESLESGRARLTVTNHLHLALDTPAWEYTTGGDLAWHTRAPAHLGRANTASVGPIPYQQGAWMETQAEGPGVVTFWWATSNEWSSSLRFLVNGRTERQFYGATGWELVSVALPAGAHRLRWQIHNNDFQLAPARAWVDSVSIRAGVPPAILSASSNFWFMPDNYVLLSVAASGDAPLYYQWFAGTNRITWGASDALLLYPHQLADGVSYSVTVSNYFGAVTSAPMLARGSPRLDIETDATGAVHLIWPRAASEFVLEQTDSFLGPWSAVPQSPVYSETACFTVLPTEAATNRWFRLRLP